MIDGGLGFEEGPWFGFNHDFKEEELAGKLQVSVCITSFDEVLN